MIQQFQREEIIMIKTIIYFAISVTLSGTLLCGLALIVNKTILIIKGDR